MPPALQEVACGRGAKRAAGGGWDPTHARSPAAVILAKSAQTPTQNTTLCWTRAPGAYSDTNSGTSRGNKTIPPLMIEKQLEPHPIQIACFPLMPNISATALRRKGQSNEAGFVPTGRQKRGHSA